MSDADRTKLFKLYKTVGTTKVWQIKNANDATPFFFVSGMSVDVDGAPNAYAPIGTVGPLDYLGNANSKPKTMAGNWTSIVTDKSGKPIRQTTTQPFPGHYISMTSIHDDSFNKTDTKHYADATKIPYIALPPAYFSSTGLKLGDFALVINANNGRSCFAIFADTKNLPNLGEASAKTAELLGLPTDLRWKEKRKAGDKTAQPAGANSGIITLVFPGSAKYLGHEQGHRILTEEEIQLYGKFHLYRFAVIDHDDTFALSFRDDYTQFTKALEQCGYLFMCRDT